MGHSVCGLSKSYLPQQSIPNLPQLGTAFNQSSYLFHHQLPWNLEIQVSSLSRPTTKYTIKFASINRKGFPQKSNLRL